MFDDRFERLGIVAQNRGSSAEPRFCAYSRSFLSVTPSFHTSAAVRIVPVNCPIGRAVAIN